MSGGCVKSYVYWLYSAKETLFCMTFEVKWLTGQCFIAYKCSLTGGLTLC